VRGDEAWSERALRGSVSALILRLALTLTTALPLVTCKKDPDDGVHDRATASPVATAPAPAPDGPPPSMHPPPGPPAVVLELVASDLVAPTDLVTAPDGTMVVLEQAGTMRRLAGETLEPFGDISDRVVPLKEDYDERGLLGMAFHPRWPADDRVFLYYSAPLRSGSKRRYDHTNVLSEFRVKDGRLDASSERELLSLPWPAPNHDGGTLMFGPDGMLYVSMGDGGLASDVGRGHPPMGNGQDYTTLMGSILRIDPDARTGTLPYGIPPDNPFVGTHEGRDEIWAYGLRNPYSFSFDTKTGMLVAGDVGQDIYEEIDVIERGRNYGWSIREGPSCLNPERPTQPKPECPDEGEHGEPLEEPVAFYAQPDSEQAEQSTVHGISVIGGEVYRGTAIPDLEGAYVFGDWSRAMDRAEGMLMVARPDDDWSLHRLPVQGISTVHIGRYVRGFGRDRSGEIYVLTSDRKGTTGRTGRIWRIAPAGS
jgi:glucose/arabinose dehydrogenase